MMSNRHAFFDGERERENHNVNTYSLVVCVCVCVHSLLKHVPSSSNMLSLCTKTDWSLVVSDYACKLTSLKAWLDIIMRSLLLILAFY